MGTTQEMFMFSFYQIKTAVGTNDTLQHIPKNMDKLEIEISNNIWRLVLFFLFITINCMFLINWNGTLVTTEISVNTPMTIIFLCYYQN